MARSTASLLVTPVALILGACTLEPQYHRPPAPVPTLPGGTAGGPAAADIGWREFFPDPQLQQLIALALTDNRDLRVAVLNVQSAQAQYRIQRAELFPTINASAVEQAEGIPLSVLAAQFPGGAAAAGVGWARSRTWPACAAGARTPRR